MFSLYDWLHFAKETIFFFLTFFYPQLFFVTYHAGKEAYIIYLAYPRALASHFVWPPFKPTDAINFNYYQIHQRFANCTGKAINHSLFHFILCVHWWKCYIWKNMCITVYIMCACAYINILKLKLIFSLNRLQVNLTWYINSRQLKRTGQKTNKI